MTYLPSPTRYDGEMHYRRAGRSGVLLPAISLGMWHNFGAADSFSESCRKLHFAFDRGITHFDLANNYGPPNGAAEETLGKLLQTSFAPYRDELFLSTKAGHDMWAGPYGTWGSRKSLMASIDQSLRRLHTDYVDIFYSHRYDPETPLEETLQALVDIVRQGKALYVGLSKYPPEAATFAFDFLRARHTPCLLYQGRYNLLHRAPETQGLLHLSKQNGSGFVAFSPLAQGLLSDRYLHGIPTDSRMAQNAFLKRDALTPALLVQLNALNAVAQRRGQTLAELSLAWLLRNDLVTSVIVGASSIEQLDNNLRALRNTTFSPEEEAEIERILQ